MEKDLLYKIALTLVPEIGDVTAKNLISFFGDAETVFKQKKQKLIQIPGIADKTASILFSNLNDKSTLLRAERELEFVEKNKVEVLSFEDENYPQRLRYCSDAPVLLYYKGTANLNTEKIISVVGTRTPSDYGISSTEKLINELSHIGALIVSGLAYGIDITAHQAALQNNLETIGVVAHGHDRIYPAVHDTISRKMEKQGGILTEFLSETNPDRENFPKRNRIVAGMCDALIVVETRLKGGSLITAEIANSYNKDVFAFPGRSTDELSSGCNAFIKRNKAVLIENAADLLYVMNWQSTQPKNKKSSQIPLMISLNEKEQIIVDILKEKETVHVDEICHKSNFTNSEAAGVLLQLEFSNIIKSLPGKTYSLNQ